MKHALTFLTALILAALTSLHAADAPVAKPVTIVAFGDSTTAVRGSTKVYASLLQKELRNVIVINADLLDIQQAFVEQARKRAEAVDTLLSDGMHPNDGGHRIEADLLCEHILGLAKSHGLLITEGPL